LEGNVKFPSDLKIETEVIDFICQLLVEDPNKRLGRRGVDEVKNHSWLKHVSCLDVVGRKLKPPIVPELSHAGYGGNFSPRRGYHRVTQFCMGS
jgi:protein kinase X